MDHLRQAIEPCGIVMGLNFPFPFKSNGGELCSNKQFGIDE